MTQPYPTVQGGFGAALLSQYQQRDQFDVTAWLVRVLQRSASNTPGPVLVVPEEVKRGGFSSLAASPEAGRLREYLQTPQSMTKQGSIFDLPPLNLGRMFRPLAADDDLLSEMLDDTRF